MIPLAAGPTGARRQSLSSPELVIVLGMSATGLSAMRLLGENGVRCWGVDVRGDLPGFASRYCERAIFVRDLSARELGRVLSDVVAACGARPVVVPTTDRFVRLLGALHNPVRGLVDVALPSRTVLAELLDKQRFATRAAELGLRVPRSVAVIDLAHLGDAVRQVGYPALVKPRAPEKAGGHCPKAVVLESAADLTSLQARSAELAGTELLVQEYVPGDDLHHLSVAVALDTGSRLLATFVARKRRQSNHGAGVGTFVESYRDDEATAMAVEFLQQLGYVGVAEMELKRHAGTGELFAIEVNPRLWSQATLPAKLGLNFAMLYCHVATGFAPAKRPVSVPQTATWQDAWGDFYWTFCRDGYFQRGEVTLMGWVYQTLTSRAGTNFSWRDPLPAIKRFSQGVVWAGKRTWWSLRS